MPVRRYRIVSTGQFTDAFFATDGPFIGATSEAESEVHRQFQQQDIEERLGEPVEAVDGDTDPWDARAPLALVPQPPEPTPPPPTPDQQRITQLEAQLALIAEAAGVSKQALDTAAASAVGLGAGDAVPDGAGTKPV